MALDNISVEVESKKQDFSLLLVCNEEINDFLIEELQSQV